MPFLPLLLSPTNVSSDFMQGVDLTVIEIIDYFTGVMAAFANLTSKYGKFFGLIGLVWIGFQLITNRMQTRKAIDDYLGKVLAFVLLMSLYRPVTTKLMSIALDAGKYGSNQGETKVAKGLKELRTKLKNAADVANQSLADRSKQLTKTMNDLDIYVPPIQYSGNNYSKWLENAEYAVKNSNSSTSDRREAMEAIRAMRNSSEMETEREKARTLQCLNEILIDKTTGGNLASSYVGLDMWLKNKKTKQEYPYYSPQAIFNLGMLSCQVLWQRATQKDTASPEDENDKEMFGFAAKIQKAMDTTLDNLITGVMAGACCVMIIISTVSVIFQYTMCIVEYVIVVAIGVFFLPFILFDGTKDIPKKFIPVFTGFFVKMLVMNACMMLVFYLYISFTVGQIQELGGMNWVTVGLVAFSIMISMVLTSNAPKMAMTILTGQPQLSMGEAMQAVGTMAGAAAVAKGVAKTATSPLLNGAKDMLGRKAERWAGQKKGEREYRKEHDKVNKKDYDMNTSEGKTAYNDAVKADKSAMKAQGHAYKEEIKEKQQDEYRKNGSVLGSIGRTGLYLGKSANIRNLIQGGQSYNGPQSSVNMDYIGKHNKPEGTPPDQKPSEGEHGEGDRKNGVTNSPSAIEDMPDAYDA